MSQAQRQTSSIFAAQRDLLDSLAQMNEHWLERARSEAELAGTFASKLAAARSFPDATGVYSDWLSERINRYVADSNHVLLDVQKFIQTGTRFLQNGQAHTGH